MKKPQTSFERFEYKYWVSAKVAKQFMDLAGPYLRCDDWAPGGQRNTSLYLDSYDLDFAQMHLESSPDRFKLRVRAYGDPPSDPAFIEIKRKVKAVIFKRRAVVPLAAVPQILRGESTPSLRLKSAEEESTLAQFLYLMMTYRAEPKALVTYRRSAYTSLDPGEGVRVTVDRNVQYQVTNGYTLNGDPRAWNHLCGLGSYEAEASTLIEFKFRGIAPAWAAEAAEYLSLTPSSYSKYVSAMVCAEIGPEGLIGTDLVPRDADYSLRGW